MSSPTRHLIIVAPSATMWRVAPQISIWLAILTNYARRVPWINKMDGKRIQALRKLVGENTVEFGKRFCRSGRTVENWEQDRFKPDRLMIALLIRLEKKTEEERGWTEIRQL